MTCHPPTCISYTPAVRRTPAASATRILLAANPQNFYKKHRAPLTGPAGRSAENRQCPSHFTSHRHHPPANHPLTRQPTANPPAYPTPPCHSVIPGHRPPPTRRRPSCQPTRRSHLSAALRQVGSPHSQHGPFFSLPLEQAGFSRIARSIVRPRPLAHSPDPHSQLSPLLRQPRVLAPALAHPSPSIVAVLVFLPARTHLSAPSPFPPPERGTCSSLPQWPSPSSCHRTPPALNPQS
jgi:hypothetical protein